MNSPRPRPGFSLEFRAVAWFCAWVHATHAGESRLASLAATELRALGVEVAPAPGGTR